MEFSCCCHACRLGTGGARSCRSERNEQQEQRDQQREDAERFGHGEAEDQVAELALRGRGVAHRCCKVVAEDDADTNARTAHADARDTRADKFSCCRFHFWLLERKKGEGGNSPDRLVSRMTGVVEVNAGAGSGL